VIGPFCSIRKMRLRYLFIFGPGTDLVSLFILVVLIVVGATSSEKAKGSVVAIRIGMKFGRIVLQLNMHRLMRRSSDTRS